MSLLALLAQTVPAIPTSQPVPGPLTFLRDFGPIILIVIVFYFMVSGSKRKTEKAREQMLKELKRGDRVQTIGGILGTVVEAREHEVIVKVDESSNTKIHFTRSAIHRVVEDDKAESK